ncbi:hypothetical protein ACFWXK_20885 [Streptomyces sp. NPDC059070]|uniref:hypothetical protein n=1 Tax=unclassified Streptomyces TaxID=2593676 RepID=UPI0034E21FF3
MHDAALVTLYLARRDAYAAFLTAADTESNVVHFRHDGRFKDKVEAIAAVDVAYAATRAAFNMIDVEGTGPIKEARTVLERLRAMHSDDDQAPNWHDYKKAREDFVLAVNHHLQGMLNTMP